MAVFNLVVIENKYQGREGKDHYRCYCKGDWVVGRVVGFHVVRWIQVDGDGTAFMIQRCPSVQSGSFRKEMKIYQLAVFSKMVVFVVVLVTHTEIFHLRSQNFVCEFIGASRLKDNYDAVGACWQYVADK